MYMQSIGQQYIYNINLNQPNHHNNIAMDQE